MTEVYFHCSDAEHFIVDRRGTAMDVTERAHTPSGWSAPSS